MMKSIFFGVKQSVNDKRMIKTELIVFLFKLTCMKDLFLDIFVMEYMIRQLTFDRLLKNNYWCLPSVIKKNTNSTFQSQYDIIDFKFMFKSYFMFKSFFFCIYFRMGTRVKSLGYLNLILQFYVNLF